MHHAFDIEIAKKYDVNTAIFLSNIGFWIQKNMANEKHRHNGRYWTYNTVEAYATLFPYWTQKQMRTIIDKCIKFGLILKGNYNSNKHDRTNWYALTDKGHDLLNLPICPNGQIEKLEKANRKAKNGKCTITDINTDTKKLLSEKNKKTVDNFKNEEKHPFADSMDQMASEKRKIQEHEDRMKAYSHGMASLPRLLQPKSIQAYLGVGNNPIVQPELNLMANGR